MLKITVWNENKHEQEYEGIRKIYSQEFTDVLRNF